MASLDDQTISLNKYISSTGHCSRREADRLIEEGRVTLNGQVARRGNRVSPGDEVILDGQLIKQKHQTKKTYLALNKPLGVVCTTAADEPDNIIDYIGYHKRIFPIGRLDKTSTGLILLTDDGDIVNKILRHRGGHEKEYLVEVNKPITNEFVRKMSNGLPILGTRTKPCTVEKTGRNSFKIILTQGLNRQIRRMCEHLSYHVKSLHRVRIMDIHIGNLPPGQWRELSHTEVINLKNNLGKQKPVKKHRNGRSRSTKKTK